MTHPCIPPAAAALLATVCLAAACSDGEGPEGTSEPRTIVIGAVIDRSGSQAWPGWIEAIRLAESHANQALAEAKIQGSAVQGGHDGL